MTVFFLVFLVFATVVFMGLTVMAASAFEGWPLAGFAAIACLVCCFAAGYIARGMMP